METAKFYILFGLLLFAMAITPGLLKKLPFTTSIIYLIFGIFLGPTGINIISLNQNDHAMLFEVISEITVIVSLFTVGLKLRVPFKDPQWWTPFSFATVSMVITIGLIALGMHLFLKMDIGHAILAGAVLAPTDPVLASEVQLKNPHDHNRIKFILTTEGGLNDGTAFPFVMMGLGLVGAEKMDWSFLEWLKTDLLWAISAGLVIGCASGFAISKIASYVKLIRKSYYLEDFLTISSIALSYGLAIQMHAYGFLAVFANALTIRQIELARSNQQRYSEKDDLPDDVLSFNEQLERIFEVISVGLVGILLDLSTFSWVYLIFALTLFFIIRPAAIFLGTIRTNLTTKEKTFLSWFGVRGIGSVYYLFFVLNNSIYNGDKKILLNFTLWTIFFSIILHGSSVKILLKRLQIVRAPNP